MKIGMFFALLIPYTFWGMYIDYANHSMMGYLGTLCLCLLSGWLLYRTRFWLGWCAANLCSILLSFQLSAHFLQEEQVGYFFKPFSVSTLLLSESALFIVVQFIVFFLLKQKQKEESPSMKNTL
jgi:hypothetical protein